MKAFIYLADIEVQSPILFSSRIAGGTNKLGLIIESGMYIHNYPLIYGLLERPSEAPFIRQVKTHQLKYRTIRDVLEKLRRGDIGEETIYVYPPTPVHVRTVFIHSTMILDDAYFDFRGSPKTNIARNQNYVAIAPGSKYKTIIISGTNLLNKRNPYYIEIGIKRLGILKLRLYGLDEKPEKLKKPALSSILVNIGDAKLLVSNPNSYEFLPIWEKPGTPDWNIEGNRIGIVFGENLYVLKFNKGRRREKCIALLPNSIL